MVTVCFLFISYKFQHQASSLRTVVSIRMNGVRDIRSIFHCGETHADYIFYVRGIIHHQFVDPRTTENALYYKIVQQKVKKVVKKKCSDHHWFLHHDNAPLHRSLVVQQSLTKKVVTAIHHLLYSSDLSPCDFFLFPQFKRTMKGKQIQTTEEIRLATERVLCKIPPVNFQHCNTQWVAMLRQCRWQMFRRWPLALL